jgi:hypothetical protein
MSIFLLALLSVGCSTPVDNDVSAPPAFHEGQYATPHELFREGNLDFFIDEREFLPTRHLQLEYDPDFVPDGTLMTDCEIVIYYAGHLTGEMFGWDGGGGWSSCDVYDITYTTLYDYNAMYPPGPWSPARYWVWYFEVNGYDVPDVLDIDPYTYCPDAPTCL